MDSGTVRVLSLDGGGMRGYLSAVWLDKFIQMWGISGNELWKYFDVIAGSSIGGIMALAYASGKSPTDILPFFTEDGPWIFTTSSSTPSSRPSTLTKINTIVGGPLSSPTFYPSTTDGIGTKRLKSKLDNVFGTQTMQDMKTNVLITSFEKNDTETDFTQDTNTPIYFSNSNIVPVLIGQNNLAVDVAMATSAAPLYFPSWKIGEDKYIDGGVVQNNPASLGLSIGKALKPTARRYCVLSIGTGLGDVGFASGPDNSFRQRVFKELEEIKTNIEGFANKWQLSIKEANLLKEKVSDLGVLEGAYLIMYLIGAMGGGAQEVVAKELEVTTKYTLDNLYYYRMQYYLDPAKDTELDHSTPEILEYYRSSVIEQFNKDQANIAKFLEHLTA